MLISWFAFGTKRHEKALPGGIVRTGWFSPDTVAGGPTWASPHRPQTRPARGPPRAGSKTRDRTPTPPAPENPRAAEAVLVAEDVKQAGVDHRVEPPGPTLGRYGVLDQGGGRQAPWAAFRLTRWIGSSSKWMPLTLSWLAKERVLSPVRQPEWSAASC